MHGGAWWATVPGVAKSRTWLSDFTFAFHFHALEKEMATHSNVLVWRIPGTGEPGGLLSMGLHRVWHDWSDFAAAAAASSFYSCFLESFYHKWMLNFIKGFLCIYWDNHMAFIFQFVNAVYYIDWFADIEEFLHPWDKAHLVMMYDFLNMLYSVC